MPDDGRQPRPLPRRASVLEAEKHPNADRLQLCRVDVGEGEPRQIVCGAWNFGAGATVAVALPGAVLPGGLEARAAQGSRRALGRDDPRRGRDRARHRPLRDHGAARDRARARRSATCCRSSRRCCSSSRPATGPTCSRSTASRARSRRSTTLELAPCPGDDPEPAGDEPVDVTVEDFEGCPRYIGRALPRRDVGPSPVWLQGAAA